MRVPHGEKPQRAGVALEQHVVDGKHGSHVLEHAPVVSNDPVMRRDLFFVFFFRVRSLVRLRTYEDYVQGYGNMQGGLECPL